MQNFLGHFVCAVLLIASGVGLLLLNTYHVPVLGAVYLIVYFRVVMPWSIASGMAINPLTYTGILCIGGVQFIIVGWILYQLVRSFMQAPMRLSISDFMGLFGMTVVATIPFIAAECYWLGVLKKRQTDKVR